LNSYIFHTLGTECTKKSGLLLEAKAYLTDVHQKEQLETRIKKQNSILEWKEQKLQQVLVEQEKQRELESIRKQKEVFTNCAL
jgi:hypothetical protein